jgi:hypothetical protein
MLALIALSLFSVVPSAEATSWMRPEAFELVIGMSRDDAMNALALWKAAPGKNDDEVVVTYSDEKALTLQFRKDRLVSVRFELFGVLPAIRKAFEEERDYLLHSRGQPRRATKSILIYDNILPNIMVVVADDPNSEQAKKGLGTLAVRYYDPR